MDLYLLKDQPVEFSGAGTPLYMSGRLLKKMSAPLDLNLSSSFRENGCDADGDDSEEVKDYCKMLTNSLIENEVEWKNMIGSGSILERSNSWKGSLSKQKDLNVTPTLTVSLTLPSPSTTCKGRLEISNSGTDKGINILHRLRALYGKANLKVDITLKIKSTTNRDGFQCNGKDLTIGPLNPYYQNTAVSQYGCYTDLPSGFKLKAAWMSWSQGGDFRGHVTVKLTLNHQAVAKLLQYDIRKMELLQEKKGILEEGVCSDLVIVAENGVEIKCHKVFLAAKSEVFKVMFESRMKEDTTGRLELLDMSEAAVRAFLDVIYHWDFQSASENCEVALELLRAGHMYAIAKMKMEENLVSLISVKPNDWFDVGTAVKLLLFARNLDGVSYKNKMVTKAVNALQYRSKLEPNSLLESMEYKELFQRNPKVAMELTSLLLKKAGYYSDLDGFDDAIFVEGDGDCLIDI